MTASIIDLPERQLTRGGVTLRLKDAGTGPPVVFLHGFPEFWYSWRHQLPRLATAGYRVIAPDLRGYHDSDKPADVDAYTLEELVADAIAVIESAGEPVTLVGHDWGGMIAWFVAMQRPELLRKLVILNAPHPVCYMRELRATIEQKLRASYQLFLRLPAMPEFMLPLLLPAFMRRFGRFTEADVAVYRESWKRPGAIRAMANYYRALQHSMSTLGRSVRTISVPTLIIWGENDPAFSIRTLDHTHDWVPHLRVEVVRGAGHFVQTDAAERVTALLLDFLA
jgi:epoxide hydrolase 4